MGVHYGQRPLLTNFPGAAAAYSLRSLSNDFLRSPVVRVRRSSDNAERDFTSFEINDGSLVSWVGVTASDDGLVTTWYDQSGNGNDATQATASNQPKIVDAGILVKENNKPAIDFDGSDDFLISTNPNQTVTDFFTFIVLNKPTTINERFVLLYNNIFTKDAHLGLNQNSASTRTWYDSDTSVSHNLADFSSGNHLLFHHFMNQNALTIGLDGTTYVNEDPITSFNRDFSAVKISGRGAFSTSNFFNGVLQELVIYTSDKSSNRLNIEKNINNYYNIY